MNFFRWLSFWPVAIVSGVLASGAILILGDLLLGHWWLTGCLVIGASAVLQPVVATLLAMTIAPRINMITARSILLPYLVLCILGTITLFALLFLDYEGDLISSSLFGAVSPWWYSLSASVGWIYGFGFALNIWGYFLAEQQMLEIEMGY